MLSMIDIEGICRLTYIVVEKLSVGVTTLTFLPAIEADVFFISVPHRKRSLQSSKAQITLTHKSRLQVLVSLQTTAAHSCWDTTGRGMDPFAGIFPAPVPAPNIYRSLKTIGVLGVVETVVALVAFGFEVTGKSKLCALFSYFPTLRY